MFVIGITNLILGIITGVIGGGGTVIIVKLGPHISIKIGGGATVVILTALAEFWIFTQTFSF